VIMCRHCERGFADERSLNDHLWAKHPEVKRPPPDLRWYSPDRDPEDVTGGNGHG
jgi:hypothetical protein